MLFQLLGVLSKNFPFAVCLSVCLRAIIVGGLFYATLNFPPARAPCCNFACGSSGFKDIAELILRLDGSAAARRRAHQGLKLKTVDPAVGQVFIFGRGRG